MTLCLASFTENNAYIVGICDAMISNDDWCGDSMAMKARPLPNDWCMMAAGDQSEATPILESVRASLLQNRDKSLLSTVTYFQQAFYELLNSKIQHMLKPFGMNLENYHEIGPALGPTFQSLLFKISTAFVDAKFLVFGYDSANNPHMFTIRDRGDVEYFDTPGIAAIGSGQTAALGHLFNQRHSRYRPYQRVLLNVCEAKFAAERAPGVGRTSLVVVVHPSGEHFTAANLDEARKAYERVRRKPVTKSQRHAVKTLIAKLESAHPAEGAKPLRPTQQPAQLATPQNAPVGDEPIH
jgi:20S proteasome alpha/beta subunit